MNQLTDWSLIVVEPPVTPVLNLPLTPFVKQKPERQRERLHHRRQKSVYIINLNHSIPSSPNKEMAAPSSSVAFFLFSYGWLVALVLIFVIVFVKWFFNRKKTWKRTLLDHVSTFFICALVLYLLCDLIFLRLWFAVVKRVIKAIAILYSEEGDITKGDLLVPGIAILGLAASSVMILLWWFVGFFGSKVLSELFDV